MEIEKPECECGFTRAQVERIMGEHLAEFDKWMIGQTQAICEGRRYNHDTREYEVACDGKSHGIISYSFDVLRFIEGGEAKDWWD